MRSLGGLCCGRSAGSSRNMHHHQHRGRAGKRQSGRSRGWRTGGGAGHRGGGDAYGASRRSARPGSPALAFPGADGIVPMGIFGLIALVLGTGPAAAASREARIASNGSRRARPSTLGTGPDPFFHIGIPRRPTIHSMCRCPVTDLLPAHNVPVCRAVASNRHQPTVSPRSSVLRPLPRPRVLRCSWLVGSRSESR